MTGCGCLGLLALLGALVVIFVRGSFDAGEPIEQAVALAGALLAVPVALDRRGGERPARELVRARHA